MFKETKEVIVAVMAIALFLCLRLKDGAQIGDAEAAWEKLKTDEEFKGKILAAYDNVKAVPSEFKGVGWMGYFSLAMMLLGYIPQFVAALKKE